MKTNVGTADKIIRVIVALVLAVIGYVQNVWWLYVVAAVVAGTALIGWCGLYTLVGISTCPIKKK